MARWFFFAGCGVARNGRLRRNGPARCADRAGLLDASFPNTHCFSVERGRGGTAGLIGLAFQPVSGHPNRDFRGVFWLDPHTSRLRAVASLLEQGGELLCAANPGGAVVYSSERTTRAVEEAAPTPAETAAPRGSSANPPGA